MKLLVNTLSRAVRIAPWTSLRCDSFTAMLHGEGLAESTPVAIECDVQADESVRIKL